MKVVKYIIILLIAVLVISLARNNEIATLKNNEIAKNEKIVLTTVYQKTAKPEYRLIINNRLSGTYKLHKNTLIYNKDGYYIIGNNILPPGASYKLEEENNLYNYKTPSKQILIKVKNE